MSETLILVLLIVFVALAFDYINGFHDAANSVATIVATRVLTPFQAVVWAAFFNFAAAVPLFLTGEAGVAKTVGSGMVELKYVTPLVILAGLLGAIAWDLITWWFGLPTSSSHALIGGYAGAAIARVAFDEGLSNIFHAIVIQGWVKTLFFIVLAPMLGMALAYLLMIIVYWGFRNATPRRMDRWFRHLQLLSAALFSYSHGANDAQKTMGIIAGVLVAAGYLEEFRVDWWVILSAHAAIALGTMTGGWRIVKTMGARLTRLKPRGGFCAETAGALAILFPTYLGIPVSTTHVISGAIAGVGAIRRPKAVRWGLATNILWAWLLTLPAAALVAAICMTLIRVFVGHF
ncbi:inorganic phosphate transporter [Bryobacter aggregatus]|uniref:inorganic phosphate transporter n=1 Tax=Bryobacter aggregatus TaxID=360054 RepID=UPI0004E0F631|nr:inorganic phosphate transporter [Bryobacter aggregatus]